MDTRTLEFFLENQQLLDYMNRALTLGEGVLKYNLGGYVRPESPK